MVQKIIDPNLHIKTFNVKCDKKLIEQIIINLFSNSFYALKNTKNPTIKMVAEATDKRIFIHFSDNGSGIEKEKLHGYLFRFTPQNSAEAELDCLFRRTLCKCTKGL